MRHLMSPLDFTTDELEKLFDLANEIEKQPEKYAHICEGKILATCFYAMSYRHSVTRPLLPSPAPFKWLRKAK